jgi:hypothetical protein
LIKILVAFMVWQAKARLSGVAKLAKTHKSRGISFSPAEDLRVF